MTDKMATLGVFDDAATAQRVKKRLEAAGIPAQIPSAGGATAIQVEVPAARLPQAQQVLAADPELEEEELDPDEVRIRAAITQPEDAHCIVTLARFFDPMAAQLVKQRLDAAGIR